MYRMETYRFTYSAQPSTSVVKAVAWAKGVPPTELKPLHRSVDPDALDEILGSQGDVSVSFSYEGCEVDVDGKGHIAVGENIEDASNILVLDDGDNACLDLLSLDPFEERSILCVTFSDLPQIDMASDIAVVHVGDFMRGRASMEHPIRRETVEDPTDLCELGMTISEILSEQESTLVCFNSIDDLLQHVELQTAFRFLHILTARVESVSAVAHYHLDVDEEEVRRTLEPLFDGSIKRL